MKRIILTLTGLLFSVALLTGCSGQASPSESAGGDPNVSVGSVVVSSGESINCAVYDGFEEGGIQCDWDTVDAPALPALDDSNLSVVMQPSGDHEVECIIYNGFKGGGASCNL